MGPRAPSWRPSAAEICPGCRIVQALEEEYVHNRGLVLRILPNAFLESMRGQAMALALSRFHAAPLLPNEGGRTLVLDLSPELRDLRAQFDRKWRNQLTGAEKKNLTVTSGTSLEEFRTFESLYREMRMMKPFDSGVRIEEFALMQDDLPQAHRMRVFLCFEDRTPLAGLVTSAMGKSAIYLLGATIDKGRWAKASFLLQWNLLQWLKEKQIRWYDLGGISPRKNPSVYHFKRGLSGKEQNLMGLFTLSIGTMSKMIRAGLALHRVLK